MHESTKPIANPDVLLREEFDDWAVLFNPDTAGALGLNPVGVAIWKRLDGRRDLARIAAEIRDEFPDAPDTVFEETAMFVNQLTEGGFAGFEVQNAEA